MDSRNELAVNRTDSLVATGLDNVVDDETENNQARASNRNPRILHDCLGVRTQGLNGGHNDLFEPRIKQVGLILVFIELKGHLSRVECHDSQLSYVNRQ